MFEISPLHVPHLNVDEPTDLEGLHRRHCVLRRDTVERRKDERLRDIREDVGDLFFSKDGESTRAMDNFEGMELPDWTKMLFEWLSKVMGRGLGVA
jgi:hypothetical protein